MGSPARNSRRSRPAAIAVWELEKPPALRRLRRRRRGFERGSQGIRMKDSDPCVCGSALPLRDCCAAFARTTPPPPATGLESVRCYARPLGDCSRKMTAEHFISNALLELLGGDQLTVVNPDAGLRPFPARQLKAKVLCERHNSALSPLDALATKTFAYLLRGGTSDSLAVVNGYDLERWMLKALCGYASSGLAFSNRQGQPSKGWAPPPEWLRVLFGTDTLPQGAGLHAVSGRWRSSTAALLQPVSKEDTGMPVALATAFGGFLLMFAMEPLPGTRKPTSAKTHYRANEIQVVEGRMMRTLHLAWPPVGTEPARPVGDVVRFVVDASGPMTLPSR